MKKSNYRWLIWALTFCFLWAGIAQGADRCTGRCCQVSEGPNDGTVSRLVLHGGTPLDALLPSCHQSHPLKSLEKVVHENVPCDKESNTHACCHLGKERAFVQALAPTSHFGGTGRLFQLDLVFHDQPQSPFYEEDSRLVLMGWLLYPRAAPVPLYLKKTSFIC